MKETICTIAGVVGSFIAGLFGGWDASMVTLLLFMGVDYITGLAVAACGKSLKSDTGRLSSKIGWRGLAKKCVSLPQVQRALVPLQNSYIPVPFS